MSNLKKGIKYLEEYNNVIVPKNLEGFDAFRALMNITIPDNISNDFFLLQDKIIQEQYSNKEIIDVNDLTPFKDKICLYQGDITLVKADAIVNACNSDLLGCFYPLHKCIDNAIHSFAGLQVRRDLKAIMDKQGQPEPNGKVKITNGYNLPSKFIFHTVGPTVDGKITKQNKLDLASCYNSCLELADKNELENIVFCSISTGLYGYPIEDASNVALRAITKYLYEHKESSIKKIVINVFSGGDYDVYSRRINEIN